MASLLLQAKSNKPGSATITVIDPTGADTGYRIIGEPDWGNAAWDVAYSGPRGTQGARAAGATPQNRVAAFSLRVTGSSKDDLITKISVLSQIADELRRFGGRITWRSKNQSYRQHFDVMAGAASVEPWQARAEHSNIAQLTFSAVCAPHLQRDAYDILDDFSADTEANYTFDTGTAADVAVTGGQLTASGNLTAEKRLIHTAYGHSYADAQCSLKAIPGSTITSFKAGAVFNRIDASNYLEVYVDDNGTNSRLRLDKVVATVRTNLSSTNLAARVVNGTPFWIRGRQEGINVFLEHFLAAPTPMATPTTSASYTLTGVEVTTFGPSAVGKAGIVWIPQQAAATLDDFAVEPYTYRNVTLPDELRLNGPITGDATALIEVSITPAGGAAAPIWAALGWWQRPAVYNMCWNGDFESSYLGSNLWSNAGVANINNAATSVARITTAGKYGTCSGQIVCPATAGAGANFRIFRRFKKGVTYTAEAWIHSAAGTTSTSVRVGNSAANDWAESAAPALSTTWQRISTTWIPTADRDDAHVAVKINAATATTFEIDGVMVYEGTTAPTSPNQSEGRGGYPPIGILEAESSAFGFAPNVADANYRSGFGYSGAGPLAYVIVDPTLLVPDDYTQGEISIEVWLRYEAISTDTGGCVLSAAPITSSALPSIFSEEFGIAGKTLVRPSSGTSRRFARIGTLRLKTDAGRYAIQVDLTAVNSDYLLLVPSNARALSPSGRAGVTDVAYPDFVNVTAEVTKKIRADLSATMKEPATGAPEIGTHGLGGSLLEFPPGNADTVVKLSSECPDDPTSNTATEQLAHSATVHFAVTPRDIFARSS